MKTNEFHIFKKFEIENVGQMSKSTNVIFTFAIYVKVFGPMRAILTHRHTHTHTQRNGQAHGYSRILAVWPKNGAKFLLAVDRFVNIVEEKNFCLRSSTRQLAGSRSVDEAKQTRLIHVVPIEGQSMYTTLGRVDGLGLFIVDTCRPADHAQLVRNCISLASV